MQQVLQQCQVRRKAGSTEEGEGREVCVCGGGGVVPKGGRELGGVQNKEGIQSEVGM
jgi:hypothetical protein